MQKESVRAVLNSAFKQQVRKAVAETMPQHSANRENLTCLMEDLLADLSNKLTDQLLPAYFAKSKKTAAEVEELDDMMLQFELEDEQKRLTEASQQRMERLEVVQALRAQFKALIAQEISNNSS